MNLDDLAREDIAAALQRGPSPADEGDHSSEIAHHGARDPRQAARDRSGRDRAGRAAGAAGGRSYAFRRS
ncbi:hypothetical protein AB0F72_05445 [Actinoplanes sp. NPDC023936]|uniref:hypothetical protein n=1 Tax=Actinoplanes sp. NPDC023936 TaxID=3154910 RepID=UPI00340E8401